MKLSYDVDGSKDTGSVKIGAASAPVSEWQYSVTYGRTDGRTDAQTFVQILILNRYVYMKVGLGALVEKNIFKAIL